MREQAGNLIEGILEDSKEAVRLAVEAGQREGLNPRATALEITGRINRATGLREGGILGLNSAQTDAVIRARAELLSGDPAQMRNYLTRGRRDARFDRLVQKAIKNGKPLSRADVDRITGRYKDRLLALRGEVIARNETLAGLNAGKEEGIRQLVDAGKVQRSQVKKIWRATGDDRTRDSHLALNGVEAGLDEPFISPLTGAQMMYPHDTSRGAPASEIIQCRCFYEVKIDYLAPFRGN
jgi:hypothetical protein